MIYRGFEGIPPVSIGSLIHSFRDRDPNNIAFAFITHHHTANREGLFFGVHSTQHGTSSGRSSPSGILFSIDSLSSSGFFACCFPSMLFRSCLSPGLCLLPMGEDGPRTKSRSALYIVLEEAIVMVCGVPLVSILPFHLFRCVRQDRTKGYHLI